MISEKGANNFLQISAQNRRQLLFFIVWLCIAGGSPKKVVLWLV